jgi:hypothetical protein
MPGAGNRPNTGKKTKAIGIAAIIGLILILIATAIFVYDKTHQDLDIKIDVPVFVAQSTAEDAAVASANRQMRSLIDARIADFRRDHAKAVAEGATGPAWSLEIEHGPLQRGAHFLAVLIGGYEFSGGAHGMNIIEPLVFALADGRRIQPEDLFRPNSAWLNRLARHCYAELKLRDFGLRDEAWVRAGTEPVAKNYRLLLPGPDGLRVIFEPYAVASYSDGTQEVLIAYRDLADILAPALF